jgi:hypothetical protein
MLARAAEAPGKSKGLAQSIIVLWLQGGPSQLETFDPHPGTRIAAGTGAIDTALKGVQLAPGLERVAEEMGSISLIRSMVSKEGDHERGTYTMKTGFRPDPTVIHPSIGAVLCHELPAAGVDIPRHVSILPGQWAARGGFLGDQYDAFRMDDPAGPVPDTQTFLPKTRDEARLKDLDVVEGAFARGRGKRADGTRLGGPERSRSSWLELQEHASFPAASTRRTEEELRIPAGTFPCLRYDRTEDDGTWRFWFAPQLPGQPVRFEHELDGVIVFSSTLLDNTPAPG